MNSVSFRINSRNVNAEDDDDNNNNNFSKYFTPNIAVYCAGNFSTSYVRSRKTLPSHLFIQELNFIADM